MSVDTKPILGQVGKGEEPPPDKAVTAAFRDIYARYEEAGIMVTALCFPRATPELTDVATEAAGKIAVVICEQEEAPPEEKPRAQDPMKWPEVTPENMAAILSQRPTLHIMLFYCPQTGLVQYWPQAKRFLYPEAAAT